ncbi:DEAD/DEAH box helicase family protein [Candidatus Saccharibacteria bacterium]|nr:MAG: DEAD/DEAH box helicase family protein [Candidatus Saccharibacteria bacterium]
MNKSTLTEAEIRTRYITPAILAAGWPLDAVREEFVYFTKGRIEVRGKLSVRKDAKRVDYLLMRNDGTNTPLAVVEAKDNKHGVGDGMQQAVEYAESLDVPFVFTCNGDSFLMRDRTGLLTSAEKEIALNNFPSPAHLDSLYKQWRGIERADVQVLSSPYYEDGSGKQPRYYQRVAINRTIEAIAKDQKRILLVMATGTGKTYTAAQIIWRYWKAPSQSSKQKRILFLADRNILVDQTKTNDFKHFGSAMTKITGRNIEKEYEIYLSLYQAISGSDEARNAYKEFSPDFFDLIVVDECHRGSSKEDSSWQEILRYFNSATQVGLTATPIETKEASNTHYFGEPIYTYSLKNGIDDGFLAPYKVIRVATDVDTFGYRPEEGEVDDEGNEIEDREYSTKDFDRRIILPQRDQEVARYLTKFLEKTDPYAKTIVFARTINHAERLRRALVNINAEKVRESSRYIMRITGDDELGKAQLDNFIDPESRYPVIAITSKLMTTGVDAQTCKVIVLDSNIESMTEFKQIIGRGTRVREDYGKTYFTILDFRNVTKLFADPDFDGDPVKVYEPKNEEEFNDTIDAIDESVDEATSGSDDAAIDSFVDGAIYYPDPKDGRSDRPVVHTISSQKVTIIGDSVRIMDTDGKLITESLTDYTRKNILGEYATLDEFLQKWSSAKQKYFILDEMAEKDIPIYELADAYGKDADMFDVVTSIAYGQKPLGRKTRAEKVRHSRFINQYQGKAREVLEALVDKYESTNLKAIEEREILKVQPLDSFGTPIEIANLFGGIDGYEEAVGRLAGELYEVAI